MTDMKNINAGKSQLKILWDKICERLEKVVNPISFETFIRDLEPVDISGRHLILRAGTDLAAATVINQYSSQIKVLMNAQQAQMRSQLLKDYYTYTKRGYVLESELEDWESQYQAYHSLGANGILDSRRDALMKLESRKEVS